MRADSPWCHVHVLPQPLDKMEQTEIQKQAEKFVEPGFKLVTQTKVRGGVKDGAV